MENRQFDADSGSYSGSDIQTYLRSNEFYTTYGLNKDDILDVNVTSSIEATTVGSGDDKAFLLSLTEVNTYFGAIPTLDDYEDTEEFEVASSEAQAKRVAKHNDTVSSWWLRSLNANGWSYPTVITDSGHDSMNQQYVTDGLRPAMWVSI